jgi:hypothetical protein
MSRGTAPRILTLVAVLTMVVSAIGVIVALILNAFLFDEYDAYGEVPIPGSSSLALPEGEVLITFHTVVIGGTGGGGLPVPPMSINIVPPAGVPDPVLIEDIGGTTTVNNDARVRVWVARIAAAGVYDITTDGNVSAFLQPRLSFGHGSSHGRLPMVFGIVFGIAVVDLVIARIWAARVRSSAPADFRVPPSDVGGVPSSFTPTDQGIRLQQLETLARLRDSGALTHDEYETEKRRVLDGL